jgi:BASS family bile acid:Na+ symporter
LPQIVQLAVTAALALTMFGMGLGLLVRDFSELATQPRPVIVGTIAKMIGLPMVGFLAVRLTGLDGPLAVGLILIAACPGGPTANLLTAFAYGDLALSIVLTAISDVLTIVSIPLLVNAAAARFMPDAPAVHLPIAQTMAEILAITIVPTALGMLVRARRPELALRLEPQFRRFALAVLVVLVAGTFLRERARLLDHIRQVGGAVILLNVLAVSLAWIVARAARVGRARVIAITIEVGIQNAVMAMTVALALLQRADVAIPAVVYAGLMYMTAATIVFGSRLSRRPEGAPARRGRPAS